MSRQVKYTIAIVLFCTFLICLGMSLIFPVMPFIRNEYHFSAFQMGMMSSLFALVQFAASPIVGQVSDRFGRKPMLVWGLLVFGLAEFLFAIGNQLWMFDLSRAVDGLSAAMFVPTSMALAADITSTADRAKVIGWLSAAFSGGLILGPGIGGILAGISYKAPFWVAGILAIISTIVAAVFLPKDADEQLDEDAEARPPRQGVFAAMKKMASPTMTVLFLMILISAFGLAGFESIYSLYVNQVHHFTLSTIAGVLTVNGILSLFLQVFLFDRMVIWIGETGIIRWGFILSVIGTIFVIYDHSQWQVFIATLVVYVSFDMLRPAITTLLTKMSKENQGLLNGINMSLTSVGNVVGPLLSGALLDINYQYPYWLVIAFLSVAIVITFRLGKMVRAETKQI